MIENINPFPDQATGGEGPVAGQEVRIDVVFTPPFDLPADHYFFVPQVLLQGKGERSYGQRCAVARALDYVGARVMAIYG